MTETASFLDRIRSQVAERGSTGVASSTPWVHRPKVPRSRHVVETNRWDDAAWQRSRKVRSIEDLVGDLHVGDQHHGGTRAAFDPALELAEGVWQSTYKAVPKLKSKRQIERECYPVRQIVDEILKNPKLKDLQQITAGDPVMATVATETMGDELREILSRVSQGQGKDDKFAQPPPGGQQQQGQGGQPGQSGPGQSGQSGQGQPQPGGSGQGQGQGQGQPDPNASTQPGGGDVSQGQGQPGEGQPGDGQQGQGDPADQDLTEGASQQWDPDAPESEDDELEGESQWEDAWDEALGDIDAERLVNKAIEAAQDQVEELDSARRGIGLEDGEWLLMSPEERLKIAERLRTDEMRTLAKVIGRMRRFALGVKAQRINDVPHEAFDVEQGNHLPDVLKSEFALLATKATSYEFFRKYAGKELLQFKKRGSEQVGKGPIVMCIDKSGSMSGAPMNWALAVAEALRRFASDEDRDMYVMFFGNNSDRVRFEFPKGKAPFEKILTFLSTAANGGTAFDGVLTEGLKRATEQFDGEGRGKADIVFVTDGQANLSDDWIAGFNAERDRIGVRVYSVYIGGAYDTRGKKGPLGLLERISDAAIPVMELRPAAVESVFAKV